MGGVSLKFVVQAMRTFHNRLFRVVGFLILVCAFSSFSAVAAPSLDEIIQDSNAALAKVKDISLQLHLTQTDLKSGRTSEVVAFVRSTRTPSIVRMVILQPEALEDQIIVLDEPAKKVRIYSPVTEQILVRDSATVAKEQGVGAEWTALENVMSLPSRSEFEYSYSGRESIDGIAYYVLTLRPKKASDQSFQKVWIDPTTWYPVRLRLYAADGKPWVLIVLSEIRVNSGIKSKELLLFPKGAQVVVQ